MTPKRWRSQVLACVAVLGMPGCARQLPSVSVQMSPAPSDPRILWAGYQQVLDQRILAQRFDLLNPDQPIVNWPAFHPQTASREVPDGQQIFYQRILTAHNQERLGLGLQPLSWNPALAEQARRWADYLASTGRFEHAPENPHAPEGENLWAGTRGYFAPEAMVNAWIREKRFFRPGVFPDNSITGRVEDVGHYTQLVWRATTKVGCAEATSVGEDILVCRYGEAGNYKNERPF